MGLNIPKTDKERVVIVGAGFGGLKLAQNLAKSQYQVVLLDRNNFHQFQPLFYQVAMAGLEPSAISFPLRKAFQKNKNVIIRLCTFESVDSDDKIVHTDIGDLTYDHLVLAYGATTNYYGNKQSEKNSLSMKSTQDAISLRNEILLDYERALLEPDYDKRQTYVDIVIVGGGPTGVELAGALAEMKEHILPKDYAELDNKEVDIYLIQGGNQLLQGMSENSAKKSLQFLEELGVKVMLNTLVEEVNENNVVTKDGTTINAQKVIWAAGVICRPVSGLDGDIYARGNRVKIDQQCRVVGHEDIYVLGDLGYMETAAFPDGHPQVAQVAIQQANFLGKRLSKGKGDSFVYKDKGSMATIGRNRAVVDLPNYKFSGFLAWLLWLVVHLFSIIGVKNKLFVFVNWVWNYLTYDQSLRLIIRQNDKES